MKLKYFFIIFLCSALCVLNLTACNDSRTRFISRSHTNNTDPYYKGESTPDGGTSDGGSQNADASDADTSNGDTSDTYTSNADTSGADNSNVDTSSGDTSGGSTSNSDTSSADTSNGDTSNGGTSNADTSNGGTSNGDTSNGDTSNGDTSNGDTSNGNTSNADTSNGGTSNSDTSNGDTSNADTSNGDTSNGGSTSDVHKHSYKVRTIAPTCTEDGCDLHACGCGDRYSDNIKPALGHDYLAQVIAPTCSSSGYTLYICSRCGSSYADDIIPASSHSYTSKVIEPTCTENGYTLHTCSVCGKSYSDNAVSALGHDWSDWIVTEEPTTSSEGTKMRFCETCYKRETASIDKLPDNGGGGGGGGSVSDSDFISEVVRLVNIEREKEGLDLLQEVSFLDDYAQTRSEEISSKFEHTRPDGSSPLAPVLGTGQYFTGGENIAAGQATPEAVMRSWMNSPGHRGNILSSKYKYIGVGCYKCSGGYGGYGIYWTQIFAG